MSTSGIVRRFRQAELPVRAAALSYHTLLGLVPVLGFVFGYLNVIGITKNWRDLLKSFILSHLEVSSGDLVLDQLSKLTQTQHVRGLGTAGMLVLLWSSYNLVTKLGNALDIIFQTTLAEPSMQPRFLKLFMRRALIIAGLPIAVVLSVALTSWLQKGSWLRPLFRLESVGPYLALPLPVLVDVLALYLIYQFVPRVPGTWRASLRAAAIVGPVLSAARFCVGLASRKAFVTLQLYGAFATVPIFILWVHFMWMMILCGALLVWRPQKKSIFSATQSYSDFRL